MWPSWNFMTWLLIWPAGHSNALDATYETVSVWEQWSFEEELHNAYVGIGCQFLTIQSDFLANVFWIICSAQCPFTYRSEGSSLSACWYITFLLNNKENKSNNVVLLPFSPNRQLPSTSANEKAQPRATLVSWWRLRGRSGNTFYVRDWSLIELD